MTRAQLLASLLEAGDAMDARLQYRALANELLLEWTADHGLLVSDWSDCDLIVSRGGDTARLVATRRGCVVDDSPGAWADRVAEILSREVAV